MSFHRLTHWQPDAQGILSADIPPEWMQGRTAFGGLLTAAGYEAMRARFPDRPVRSVTSRFLEPVAGPASLTVEVLREGRSVAHASARITAGGRLCALIDGTFGNRRPSELTVPAPPMPEGPGPDDATELPYLEGIVPAFTQHVALRWTDGAFPFTGASEAVVGGWCRHRTEAQGIGALLGLLDSWPGPILPLARGPVAASTVNWTAHLLVDEAPPADGWFRFRSEVLAAAGGYATTRGMLWGSDGRPLGWMEQLVAVFDKR